ncbi:hypothetical protein K8R42_02590, partial [bacterium]|nr:hypothetical protein [bacterium]
MILEKVQHYLLLSFLIILVITQSAIFVAARASQDNIQTLQAVFINPIAGQEIGNQENIDIQAMLSVEGQDSFSAVYFTIYNPVTNFNLSFEAEPQNDGTWLSDSSWDTSGFPAGVYYLQASANVYGEDGFLENAYYSIPQIVNLSGGEYQPAAMAVNILPFEFANPVDGRIFTEEDFPNERIMSVYVEYTATQGHPQTDYPMFNFNDARFVINQGNTTILTVPTQLTNINYIDQIDISALDNGSYAIFLEVSSESNNDYNSITAVQFSLNIADNDPQVSLTDFALEGELLSPVETSLSGETIFTVGLNREASELETIYMTFSDASTVTDFGDFILTRDQASDSDDLMAYSNSINTALLDTNDQPVYPDGAYSVLFWASIIGSSGVESLPLIEIELSIANTTEPEPEEEPDFDIILHSPASGSTITEDSNILQIETTIEVEQIYFEIVNVQEPAIAWPQTLIPNVDGFNWETTIDFTDVMIDGQYYLSVMAEPSGYTEVFTLYIARDADLSEPEDLIFQLHGIESNLHQGSYLYGSSNDPNATFVFESTEQISIGASPITCQSNSMPDLVRQEIAASNAEYCFYRIMADFDGEGYIPNGNYNIYLAHADNFNWRSTTQPIAYFHGEDDQPNETILELHNAETELSGDIVFMGSSNISGSSDIYYFIFEDVDSDYKYGYSAVPADWSMIESHGLSRLDYLDTPYAYITEEADTSFLPNGQYNMWFQYGQVSDSDYESSSEIIVTIFNEENVGYPGINPDIIIDDDFESDQPEDEDQEELDDELEPEPDPVPEPEEDPVDEPSGSNVVISLDSSCIEVGITDQETCGFFRAMMNLLDTACIEQNIYEPEACEDYLNRTQVDLECQEEDIIDREVCKDYLLEKYGSNVDCQLDDLQLCGEILR